MGGNHYPRSVALRRQLRRPTVTTRQHIVVDAPPAVTFEAIRAADLSRSRLLLMLLGARALLSWLHRRIHRLPALPERSERKLDDLIAAGRWLVLEERQPSELVLGRLIWDARVDADGAVTIARFDLPRRGAVRVGWSFVVSELDEGRSLLVTETFSEPADLVARVRFRRYGRLVAPFGALARRLVLRRVRAQAEAIGRPARSGSDPKPRSASRLA